MAKGISPTARTLQRLRKDGYTAEVVEKTIPRCFIKKDFIGCIDIIAFKPTTIDENGWPRLGAIIGIQATSGSNHAARRTKSLGIPALKLWMESGGMFEVWSWSKPKDSRKWVLRSERLTLANFPVEVQPA